MINMTHQNPSAFPALLSGEPTGRYRVSDTLSQICYPIVQHVGYLVKAIIYNQGKTCMYKQAKGTAINNDCDCKTTAVKGFNQTRLKVALWNHLQCLLPTL